MVIMSSFWAAGYGMKNWAARSLYWEVLLLLVVSCKGDITDM